MTMRGYTSRFGAMCLVIIGLLLVSGCTPGTRPQLANLNTKVDPAVIEAQNRFGLDIYRILATQEKEGMPGTLVSPASITLALAMTYNGAGGGTQAAMSQALRFGSLPLETINESYHALLRTLGDRNLQGHGTTLRIANSLWRHRGVALRSDFLKRNRSYYGATIKELDFRAPGSVDIVNRWVSDQTEALIPHLLDQLSADSIMLLVNAIYFKGDWKQPFDVRHTQPMPFYLPNGSQRTVQMMQQEATFHHYQGNGFQAIRLAYGSQGDLAMYVFLPEKGSDITAFLESLTYENWQIWLTKFSPKRGLVALPRFTLEYKTKLNQALAHMGMGVAFDATQADFSGMKAITAGQRLSISDIVHQTILKVDEKGAEAAAATSVGIRVTSIPTPSFSFIADRPFFISIRDDATGALLFVGSVLDPGSTND